MQKPSASLAESLQHEEKAQQSGIVVLFSIKSSGFSFTSSYNHMSTDEASTKRVSSGAADQTRLALTILQCAVSKLIRNSMTVYARTERGQLAAYDPQSELPRKLKSILRVIDGKTTDDVYSEKLHAFGDVRGMLHSLNMAGLIQPVPAGAHHVRSNSGISDAERAVLMQPQSTNGWSATRSAYAQSSFQATRVSSQIDSDTVALPQSSSLQSELKSARALQSATELMGSFVLTHLPEQSFQILKELEEVTTLEMLAVLLSGYEQMISHLGELRVQHLAHVRQILRDNL